jgi:hypothetical protein
MTVHTMQNVAVELTVAGPQVSVRAPGGPDRLLPAFWDGSGWRARYASAELGTHAVDDHVVEVEPYTGDNALLRRGALRPAADGRRLEHADGTPFLWLADTWWMVYSDRVTDEEIEALADLRAAQGFSVIQIVAGLCAEVEPFSDAGRGEGGHPWTEGYEAINPAWWDAADRRIQAIVDRGLVPCVFGAWGNYVEDGGVETMKEHWRTVVARWGALPVVWCIAGEAMLPGDIGTVPLSRERADRQGEQWAEVARHVRENDPFGRIVTVHPSPGDGSWSSRDIFDSELLDLVMLQAGHQDLYTVIQALDVLERELAIEPRKPVINAETCYEGIMGASAANLQRLMFWTHVLRGAGGHTYGAAGLWAFNDAGAEGVGGYWGPAHWRDASKLPGAEHLGVGRGILEGFDWHDFEPHPEWIVPSPTADDPIMPVAAGIPGETRIVYFPNFAFMRIPDTETWVMPVEEVHLRDLEAGEWVAHYIDPRTGEHLPERRVTLDAPGDWRFEHAPGLALPTCEDWLLEVSRR